jgi:hypothetical protein
MDLVEPFKTISSLRKWRFSNFKVKFPDLSEHVGQKNTKFGHFWIIVNF